MARRTTSPLSTGVGEDDATNSVAEKWHVEVDQQTERLTRRLQVGDHLGTVKREKEVDSFQLDDEAIAYEHVQSRLTDRLTLVLEGDGHLSFKRNRSARELTPQCLLVNVLHEAGAERPMNFECGVHDNLS